MPNNQSTYHLVSKTFFRLPGKGITGFRGRSRDFALGIKDEYRQNLIRRRLNPARALSAEARLNGRHGPGPRSPCPGKAQLSFPWNGIHTTFLFLKEKKSK